MRRRHSRWNGGLGGCCGVAIENLAYSYQHLYNAIGSIREKSLKTAISTDCRKFYRRRARLDAKTTLPRLNIMDLHAVKTREEKEEEQEEEEEEKEEEQQQQEQKQEQEEEVMMI